MHADIIGALNAINISWKTFEHKGVKMTKQQVKKVLEYAKSKGYVTTKDLSDEEVEQFL